MPIFEKDGNRVMFAHIPKSGGSSIYLAFAAAGWKIINLSPWNHPKSTFFMLKEKFGVTEIEQVGYRLPRLAPVQHMPKYVWRTWGRFDDVFTVVRHPEERLESALAYRYRIAERKEPLVEFATQTISNVNRKWFGCWRGLGGHLIPQHHFVTRSTKVFKFESDWTRELCDRYDLDHARFPVANVRDGNQHAFLTQAHREWARRTFRRDYVRFAYHQSS